MRQLHVEGIDLFEEAIRGKTSFRDLAGIIPQPRAQLRFMQQCNQRFGESFIVTCRYEAAVFTVSDHFWRAANRSRDHGNTARKPSRTVNAKGSSVNSRLDVHRCTTVAHRSAHEDLTPIIDASEGSRTAKFLRVSSIAIEERLANKAERRQEFMGTRANDSINSSCPLRDVNWPTLPITDCA